MFFTSTNLLHFFLQSTINIIFDRVGKVDPVTRGIEIAVNYIGIQFDVSVSYQFIHLTLDKELSTLIT